LSEGLVIQVAKGEDLSQIPDWAKYMHAFNEYTANDQRTTQILLACFDGVLLIQKKKTLICEYNHQNQL
ncbi:17549_t:CDS:1, partial [Dentiscutata erythropus]